LFYFDFPSLKKNCLSKGCCLSRNRLFGLFIEKKVKILSHSSQMYAILNSKQ
jgi:hypothetical protein